MHDIGGLIWGVIVIAGVISTIYKNVQKANARSGSPAQASSADATRQQLQQRVRQAMEAKSAGVLAVNAQGAPPSNAQADLVTQQYLARRAAFQAQSQAAAAPQSAWLPTSTPKPTPLSTLAAPAPVIKPAKPKSPKVVVGPNVLIGQNVVIAVQPTIEPWHQEPTKPAGYRGFLFEQKSSLVRGIIAAEVLGAPLSLRDHPSI